MNCIAIDDEPLALDLIEDFTGKVPFLDLVHKFKSPFDALDVMQKEKIDLLFLDIQMPDITGIQFLYSIDPKPMVIFTTAYVDYAIDGFDLNAIDYLVKPFSFERFFKAVNKAYEYFKLKNIPQPEEREQRINNNKYLFVKADYSTVKINLNEILYIEGLKDYIKIYAGAKPVLTLQSLKRIEEKLPGDKFVRVHRSYIVSVDKIESIQRNRIIIGEKRIPIGDFYKGNFNKIIEGH